MATIRSYTSLDQSKKLAEILPIKSSDMTYYACVKDWRGNSIEPKWGKPTTLTKEELALPRSNFQEYEYVPCWSLASLIGVLPEKYTELIKEGGMYRIIIKDSYMTSLFYNPVDACYEIIIKLHDNKLL